MQYKRKRLYFNNNIAFESKPVLESENGDQIRFFMRTCARTYKKRIVFFKVYEALPA